MSAPLVDAHCHLPPAGLDPVVFGRELLKRGLGRLALNSTTEADWPTVVALAETCPVVAPFLGVHPWWANAVADGWQGRLKAALVASKAGVGEIGLDALATVPAGEQEAVFSAQLGLAEQLARPVAIHCCRRWGRLLDLLTATVRGRARVIIHGFAGSEEIMARLLDLGAMLSFGPALAEPRREKVRQVFRAAPPDRLLLESDWPPRHHPVSELSPDPTAPLPDLYRLGAELRAMDLDQFRALIWKNGQIFAH